jgi:tetratricopeptide (TPR) repeat protein
MRERLLKSMHFVALAEQNNAAVALLERYKQTGDLAFLAEAITSWQRVAEIAPEGDPVVTQILPNLAVALRRLFERTGDPAALTAAIETGRRAIEAAPADPTLHIAALTGLGNALRQQAARADDADALAEVVDLGRRAVTVATEAADDHLLWVARSSLANALHRQWATTSDLATLTEVTRLYRQVAEATLEGARDAAAAWSNLCDALHDLYWSTGDPTALADAISAGREAVARAGERRDEQARYIAHLSSSLMRMFERTGEQDVLEESVELSRRAVAQTEETHPELPAYLNDLAGALLRSYENSGDLGQLREAVAAAERASGGLRRSPAHLSNLAICLRALFERTGDAEALARAERSARDALNGRHTPSNTAALLSNLGGILCRRFEVSGDQGLLEEAVRVLRDAVAAAPAGHHDQAQYQSQMAGALALLHGQTHDPAMLAEAIAAARASVRPGHADNPQRSAFLLNLGRLLETQDNFADARNVYAEAAALPTAPASTRVDAARQWGICAMRNADATDAVAAFEAAIALLPQITTRRLSLGDRQYGLERIADLPAHAAAAALADGRPEHAVELLEQSRGLLLDQAMELHRDISDIRAAAPALAEQYEQLRRQIAALDQARADDSDFTGRTRSDLDEQWHALIDRIREVPALKDFLRPPPIELLSEQAMDGPVVMVCTTQWRSDALILTADADRPVRLVTLPDLSPEQVADQVARLFEVYEAFDQYSSLSELRRAQDTLRSVLAWLWDTVCGPVCDAILPSGSGDSAIWHRIWWCPVGPLALLPLQAAGQHDGSRNSVIDRAVPSYTATIRALGEIRRERRAQRLPSEKAALIVAVPDAEGAEPIAGVRAELTELIRLLPDATVLSSEDATAEGVLAALPLHEVAHFACHGISDWQVPRESHLVLSDYSAAPLSVAEMSGIDLARAELAYLSACSTTMPALRLLDESIHITGAFQLAGYQHVIGTLWPVTDRAAARFAAIVYGHLTNDGQTFPQTTRAAEAVWAATSRIRDAYPTNPVMWMSHIHVGA